MLPDKFSELFDQASSWLVVASGQATGVLHEVRRRDGKSALRLDYDFHGGGGFVVARKEVSFRMPETFEISFDLKGEGPENHFEFKVADPSNENAWRYQREDFKFPRNWVRRRLTERSLPFAWGPGGGGGPSEVGSLEFVVAAGPGGKGCIWLSDFRLEDQTFTDPHRVMASSEMPGHPANAVFAGSGMSGWKALPDDSMPFWAVDFGRTLRFGGLIVQWPEDLPARAYAMEISKDGQRWKVVHRTSLCSEHTSHVSLPKAEARHLRICFENAGSAGLRALVLKPDAFSRTCNEFLHAVATDYPRGWHPRYWHREQSYWTPIGTPEGTRRALINEEGLVEVDEGSFSLEPFLILDGILVTWAEVKIRVGLPASGAPLPYAEWSLGDLKLTVRPWVDGEGRSVVLRVSYHLENPSLMDVRLVVAARPFQVNPPWQAFRNLGGRSPVSRIRCTAESLVVEGRKVTAYPPAREQGAASFEEGTVMGFLSRGVMPVRQDVKDEMRLASGAMSWGPDVRDMTLSIPYFKQAKKPKGLSHEEALQQWEKKLGLVQWEVPDSAQAAVQCYRTAAAHILINRDGPALQPGPRRYTRTWIRDSVIMGVAMMKIGLTDILKEFLEFYQPFQREDGFVPCVVDRDGVDWLVEHDSHGQFIWGVHEVFRHGRDYEFLRKMWPSVQLAADYLIRIRDERLKEEFKKGEHAACYGLLPESASHEGYLAHPVHSYWDDFWGVRGLEAAAEMAGDLGEDGARWAEEAKRFMRNLMDSIRSVIAEKHLEYVPGSVEWADFDPTATSNAVALLDFADDLPAGPLAQMYAIYLRDFRRKHLGEMPWKNYTAYEIRIISALVRLGNREEAQELLAFFLSDRRVPEWNQWPEITWRDSRSPGHLGDVPHTWISAEYILAFTSMVVSEREGTDRLVLASGMAREWIETGDGFSVNNLPTRYGLLDLHLSMPDGHRITMRVGGTVEIPADGILLEPPLKPGQRILSALSENGRSTLPDAAGTTISIDHLPCALTLFLSQIS